MKEFILGENSNVPPLNLRYEQELHKEQLAVVKDGDGACLVLAGAGSGKTRTITYRVAYLLEQGVSPGNILLLTFTNKAAHEMSDRIQNLLGSYPVGMWSGTFHSVANRILRHYADYAGRTRNFSILDQDDAKSLMKACVKEGSRNIVGKRFPSAQVVLSLISYQRNASCSLKDAIKKRIPHFLELEQVFQYISDLYEQKKQQADVVDFDDLLVLWRKLMFDYPVIKDQIASKFKYVFVDEYQDTNSIQADIVSLISSVHGNVLVVGDDAQSIYSFRAANIENILRFPEQHPQTKQFRLTINYRSTPEILALANASIDHNTKQFPKELTAVKKSGDKPGLVSVTHGAEEAQYLAEQILKLHKEGIPLNEIAVLFRAAFHAQNLEFELTKRNIPYIFRGGMRFFERAHIKDVVSFLRVVFNHKDEAAWIRVLNLQGGIGPATASKIFVQIRQNNSIEEVLSSELKLGSKARNGWQNVKQTLQEMVVGSKLPADMIRTLVEVFYKTYAEAEYTDANDRLDDLEQFAVFAEEYDEARAFLDEVSLTESFGSTRDKTLDNEDRLVLSTIHQAKGLEWQVVCIMGLSEGKFPNQKAIEEDFGIEEERRLFYVAVTRAKEKLFCTYSLTNGHDTVFLGQPSLFLEEVPDNLFERIQVKNTPRFASRSQREEDDPVIVLDDLGERVTKKMPPSQFLRSVDEL